MGLDYGYDIYLPPRRIPRALAVLAEHAPTHDRQPLDLTLPGGARLVLPFTSLWWSDPVDASTSDTVELDTSILFDADDEVLAYADECGLPVRDDGRVQVGYVYLRVRFRSLPHPDYAVLEFAAATSRMSRLFDRSLTVGQFFTGLTATAGGACCLFDTGDGGPERVRRLNGESVDEMIGAGRFPDLAALAATWPDPGEGPDPGTL
ncbi:hypothetical protein GTW43_11865 [Streptomyces sp. SID5785]|uniref:hypothetical protein n=1 Tax=Streptomyces sp. SID5785 TaxID=2690309 RepID=UPI0013610FD6|nr:hypothetical protein [Streptomyces sp. SID5785]MZD05777.1 hypothetical protein [Streptomyces sp. SID5785]